MPTNVTVIGGRPCRKRRGPSSYRMHDARKVFDALGVEQGQTFLDLGCGPGDYALHAARLVGDKGTVLAVDKSPDMVRDLALKVHRQGMTNVKVQPGDFSARLPFADASVDVCLFSTTLHILNGQGQAAALWEAHRVLSPLGRLAVIELMKKPTSFGPPLERRISQEELETLAAGNGFAGPETTDLGFTYLTTFRKA